MSVRQFQPYRAVEIIASLYGSGYRIGGRLVLTAAHLLGEEGSRCTVRSKNDFGEKSADVVWTDPKADIALIELPKEVDPIEAITLGQLPESQTGEKIRFQMFGYPQWGWSEGDEKTNEAAGLQNEGDIYLADAAPKGLLVLRPEQTLASEYLAQKTIKEIKNDDLRDLKSEWQGMSGAAVICDGLVVAVQIQHSQPSQPNRIDATALLTVSEDKQWRILLVKHGIKPKLEIASLADVQNTESLSLVETRNMVLCNLGVMVLLLAIRHLGFLQVPELAVYDFLMRLPPYEKVDKRIAIVGIPRKELEPLYPGIHKDQLPESDLVISDKKLGEILQFLSDIRGEKHNPGIIGMDVLRDKVQFPDPLSNDPALDRSALKELVVSSNDEIISTCTRFEPGDDEDSSKVAEYPIVVEGVIPIDPDAVLGFNDLIIDSQMGKVRRQFLGYGVLPNSRADNGLCEAKRSFSYQISLQFLETLRDTSKVEKVDFKFEEKITGDNRIQIDTVIFEPVFPRTGGYQGTASGGYQILFNYRNINSHQGKAFPEVDAIEILQCKEINSNCNMSNEDLKILKEASVVLVGYVGTDSKDIHMTPLGGMSGVEVHAHMISYLLSTVIQDEYSMPQLRVLWHPIEVFCIVLSCVLGGFLAWVSCSPDKARFLSPSTASIIIVPAGTIILFVGTWISFCIWGLWLPFVPLSLGFSASLFIPIYTLRLKAQ